MAKGRASPANALSFNAPAATTTPTPVAAVLLDCRDLHAYHGTYLVRWSTRMNQRLILISSVLLSVVNAVLADPTTAPAKPPMLWADTTHLGRPFSKDPYVIRFKNQYLMYFSLPGIENGNSMSGWSIGIAQSTDLINWKTVGQLLPAQVCDKKGLAAPGARIIDGKVHLFYQTYGNGKHDAICHAISEDGVHFDRDTSNPIFHPTGDWNCGRAIDAEVFPFNGKLLLYCATRDPSFTTQMIVVAAADLKSDFSRDAWRQVCDAPILKPELPWEQKCTEAPTICQRGTTLFMFYAGAYNNAPQQIGCASSTDGIHFKRLSDHPFFPNGKPGDWNSSESGHPGVFIDVDRQTYLFYQGNNDNGHTWLLSWIKIDWKNELPYPKSP
jgi:beta-1,2-mannobiose phosphorylase / 1,2-beta-oligomannan phosphorylase